MGKYFPASGELSEGDIYSLLYYIYKNNISGLLSIRSQGVEKKLAIAERKVVFAYSNCREDSLGNYLLREKIIDRAMFDRTNAYLEKEGIRFGRALLELGLLDYDRLWKYVPDQLKGIVYSLFQLEGASYLIQPLQEPEDENIVLDWYIPSIIVEGIRRSVPGELIEKAFTGMEYIYPGDTGLIREIDLKPYEFHVFELTRKKTRLADILAASELLVEDTRKVLYIFWVLEIVSGEKPADGPSPGHDEQYTLQPGFFKSFEEAVRYYNTKYELIYKVLSKEIGPIALSILSRAVEDIIDNLPSHLKKVKLNADGSINEEAVLKSVWYFDFEKNIGEFLRGLEEILYAEIYTVKKHLGEEYEQHILKWMNRIGN